MPTIPCAFHSNVLIGKQAIINPDDRIIAVLQSLIDGSLIQLSLELKYYGNINKLVNSYKNNHPGKYQLVAIHSL